MLPGRSIYILLIALFTLIITGCAEDKQETGAIDTTSGITDEVTATADTDKTISAKDTSITEHSQIIKDTTNSGWKKKNTQDILIYKKEDIQRINAYYFHPTARCETCRNMEAYSFEAIKEWEKETGYTVIWNELNIDDTVNEHYVKEFNLQFSSLVIAGYKNEKKESWKNLENTWKLVNDKKSFKKYIIFELNQFIKKTDS